MILSSFSNPVSFFSINLFGLLGGISMTLGGLVFIRRGASMRREALKQRMALARPPAISGRTLFAGGAALAEERELVKQPFYDLPERDRREIVRQLSKLGIPNQYILSIFKASRIFIAASLSLMVLFLAMTTSLYIAGKSSLPTVLLLIFGASFGWMMPILSIRYLEKKHARAASDGLPDALELLVVCVEAGLALEDGIDRIVIELKHSQPELSDELAMTSADLKILSSRDQALANLAERIDTPSIHSVVTTLSQTLRYGTPLAQAMRVVAADMRNESLATLEEKANRLPVLMTIPMMLFIMPTIFLIVGGPAALKLMDHFLH